MTDEEAMTPDPWTPVIVGSFDAEYRRIYERHGPAFAGAFRKGHRAGGPEEQRRQWVDRAGGGVVMPSRDYNNEEESLKIQLAIESEQRERAERKAERLRLMYQRCSDLLNSSKPAKYEARIATLERELAQATRDKVNNVLEHGWLERITDLERELEEARGDTVLALEAAHKQQELLKQAEAELDRLQFVHDDLLAAIQAKDVVQAKLDATHRAIERIAAHYANHGGHAFDCVSVLDDESDHEYLDDAGTCTCGLQAAIDALAAHLEKP